jgi:hypothetical protein
MIFSMGKRRADADNRRFFDEFEKVRVSRFRAMGVIDPAKREALIPFPNGKVKLIGTGHVRFPNGGGYSYFICPKCAKLATVLHLIEDAPLCYRCCEAMNIWHASRYGFGRETRRRAADKGLDQLIAKLESPERLRFKPAHPSWQGKAQLVYNSRKLTERMRRRMISLRLNQLASQQQKTNEGLKLTRAYKPRSEALTAIPELRQIWRANSHERLQQALDKAQIAILKALESDDPRKRHAAACLMLNTKQGRERGFT